MPSQPGWAEEHIRRLTAAGIQSAFQCYNINSFESVERLMRRGVYKGPLVMNWVAISGGMDAAEHLQPGQLRARRARRRGADGGELGAQRAAGQHDGHRHGPACALRHRGQPLEPVAHGQDEHGRADRAAGAHLARIRPPDRHRPAGARDHARSASSTTRWKRRCRPTASRPTATAPTRASCARRPEACDERRSGSHRPDRSRPARPRGRALADAAGRAT